MTVLLDTPVVIDLLRGNRAALDAVRGAVEAGQDLAASVVVKVEDLIADGAGMFANQYARSHSGIDPMDYIIAATAHVIGAPEAADAALWTRNVRHFPMFAHLEPPY